MRHKIVGVDEVRRSGTCSLCGPVRVYRNGRYRGRVVWRCGPTMLAYSKDRFVQDRDAGRDARFQRLYGITVEEYDRLLHQQQGGCARCGAVPRNGLRLAVDHNHESGRVRGLLCGPCNTYLGRLEANLAMLQADLIYIGGGEQSDPFFAQPIADRIAR